MANDESGGFSKNFVPRKEVTVSDTQPADAKEGDWWYDTSNDTMRFYTGSAFVSPESAIDNESIVEVNGVRSVNQPSNQVIGDFEQDLGNWNITVSGGGNGRIQDANKSARGDYYFQLIDTSSSGNAGDVIAEISRTVNFDGVNELEIYFVESPGQFFGHRVAYDSVELGASSNWSSEYVTFDVSGISGEKTLKIQTVITSDTDYDNTGNPAVDDIKLIKNRKLTFDGAGN